MKLLRTRFGVRALMALVVVCALLAWAVKVSRDSRPAYLYAGWLNDGNEPNRLKDSSSHVRELGIDAFWATAENSPDLSIAMLQDGDVRTRRTAVRALARNSPLAEEVIPELAEALTDQDADVCAGAARALGNIWPPPRSAVPGLTRALDHWDGTVRAAAATALSAIDDEQEPPAINTRQSDSYP